MANHSSRRSWLLAVLLALIAPWWRPRPAAAMPTPAKRARRWTLPPATGRVTSFTYDARGRMTMMTDSPPEALSASTYTYDADGHITRTS